MDKSVISYLRHLCKDPFWAFGVILRRFISPYIKNDETFIKWECFFGMYKMLNLKTPRTFNEKLQWLKLHDRRPEYIKMVDKSSAKYYVSELIGEEYVIPTLGIWNSFDEIDFNSLPNQFVLKCTHDSGGLVICKDKSKLDKKAARKKIMASLKRNYYFEHREWPYRDVPRRIIAEQFMVDESGTELKDYKIFCFHGEPQFIEVDYDRFVDHKLNVYDLDWKFIDFYMTSHNDKNIHIARPKQLEKMLDLARTLTRNLIFARIDFYSINENLYFGEITLCPGCGMIDFHPKEFDEIIGKMLKLPINN